MKNHITTASHQNRVKKTNSEGKLVVFQPPSLTEFLKKKEDLSVIRAEVFELVLVFAVFFVLKISYLLIIWFVSGLILPVC